MYPDDGGIAVCANFTVTTSASISSVEGGVFVYGSVDAPNSKAGIFLNLTMLGTGTLNLRTTSATLQNLSITGLSTNTVTTLQSISVSQELFVGMQSTFVLTPYQITARKIYATGDFVGGSLVLRTSTSTYHELYITGAWSTTPITVSSGSSYSPSIYLANPDPAKLGDVTLSYVGNYDVSALYAKNIVINNGANLSLTGNTYCYGTFRLYPSATLTAASSRTVYFEKIPGSSTATRTNYVDGVLTPTGNVSFTIDAGADTVQFQNSFGYSFGAAAGTAGTILIYSPSQLNCEGIYAASVLIASSATGYINCTVSGLNVRDLNNQSASFTASGGINFKNYGGVGYCTFTPGAVTYIDPVTLVDAVPLKFTGNATIRTLNCVSSLGQGSTKALQFDAGCTYTITDAFNLTGASSSDRVSLTIKSGTTPAILYKSSGTVTATYADISYSAATGGASFVALLDTNINGGHNSGWLFSRGTGNFFAFF